MVRSKIHRATVTEANLNYVGSLTVDSTLLEMADMLPYEQVHVLNVTNGHRMITYIIPGANDSGIMCLNGAAARHGQVGDIIIVMAYGMCDEAEARSLRPHIILVDGQNRPVRDLPPAQSQTPRTHD